MKIQRNARCLLKLCLFLRVNIQIAINEVTKNTETIFPQFLDLKFKIRLSAGLCTHIVFCFVQAASSCWHSLSYSCCTPISACLQIDLFPFVCVTVSPSQKDPSHWFRVHPNPVWHHINLTTFAKTLSLKIIFTGTRRLRLQHIFWGT